jgi:hypothetical protein
MAHYFIGKYHRDKFMSQINVLKDFTDTPGTRLISEGEFTGEQFRIKLLKPKYDALKPNEILEIDLDGTYGYPPSFLEEAFGGLVRDIIKESRDPKKVESRLKLKSDERPDLIDKVKKYINNAISNR